ncbi:MAG TPA: hypothetical protein VHW43_13180 [Puia sp.]|nr:hypothetical protein [Puia sp.]
MDIEKMLVKLDGKEYSFSVEVMQDEDETIYRVTPDQGERVLDEVSPGHLGGFKTTSNDSGQGHEPIKFMSDAVTTIVDEDKKR